jgi:hypothetical protein
MKEICGQLTVKGSPLENDTILTEIGGMRMSFHKTFTGPLEAKSVVSMMGMMNQEKMAGAYVALEKLEGSIDGKKGTFCLYHSSSTHGGKNLQSIQVVPESGTQELTGIRGSMEIDIHNGEHSYRFRYEL